MSEPFGYDDEMLRADEDCPGCAGGDLVPAVLPNGFWSCPVCDAVWEQDEDNAD